MLSYTNTSKQLVLATESQDLENLVSIFQTLHSISDLAHIYNRAIQERQLWLRNLTEFPSKPWVPALHNWAEIKATEEESHFKDVCRPPGQDEYTRKRLTALIESEAQATYWQHFPFFVNLSFDGTPTTLKLAVPTLGVVDADYCLANTSTGRCYAIIAEHRVNPQTTTCRQINAYLHKRYLRAYDMNRAASTLSHYQDDSLLPNTRLVALHSQFPGPGQRAVRTTWVQLNMDTDSFDSVVMKLERNPVGKLRRYAAARKSSVS